MSVETRTIRCSERCARSEDQGPLFVYGEMIAQSIGYGGVQADEHGEPLNLYEDGTAGVLEEHRAACIDSGEWPVCIYCGAEPEILKD